MFVEFRKTQWLSDLQPPLPPAAQRDSRHLPTVMNPENFDPQELGDVQVDPTSTTDDDATTQL